MIVEKLVVLPFSPKEHPVKAKMLAVLRESFHKPWLPTTIYPASDGELVAVTMKPPLTEVGELSGLPIFEILREIKANQEQTESGKLHDICVTIYTGPQPPTHVPERNVTFIPA